jgi:hypothetical protein
MLASDTRVFFEQESDYGGGKDINDDLVSFESASGTTSFCTLVFHLFAAIGLVAHEVFSPGPRGPPATYRAAEKSVGGRAQRCHRAVGLLRGAVADLAVPVVAPAT